MTRIFDLPWQDWDYTVGNNEDWNDSSLTYVDTNSAPIALDGIAVVFVMRKAAGDPLATVTASTTGLLNGIPTLGTLRIGGAGDNLWAIQVPRASMLRIPAGSYVWEAQGIAEVTRTIGSGTVTVVEGVVR